MNSHDFFSKVLDPYEIRARLVPGLLVLLPPITYFLCVLGPKNPLLVGLASLLMAIGAPYALGSVVRAYGQRAQERLNRKWGGKPSALILLFSDNRLSSGTKRTYRELAKKKLGIVLPTAEEEGIAPLHLDSYDEIAEKLRGLTRDKKKYPLIFKELVSYGFNRNCYGIRFIGAFVAIISLLVVFFRAGVLRWAGPNDILGALEKISATETIAAVVSGLLLMMWLFHFTADTVRHAGYSYAERLLESLHSIPRPVTRGKKVDDL